MMGLSRLSTCSSEMVKKANNNVEKKDTFASRVPELHEYWWKMRQTKQEKTYNSKGLLKAKVVRIFNHLGWMYFFPS